MYISGIHTRYLALLIGLSIIVSEPVLGEENTTQQATHTASLFLPPNDPILIRSVATIPDNEILSQETRDAIHQMRTIAATQKGKLVGLAAPQVGINKAIILVDTHVTEKGKNWAYAQGKELDVYINPEITSPDILNAKSPNYINPNAPHYQSTTLPEGFLSLREGCYSVDRHVAGIVPRAKTITITAFDGQGNRITQTLHGFTAQIFQHEVDHLYGIRFPDRVGPNGKLHCVQPNQYANYRKNWQNWDNFFPWSKWLEMKEQPAPANGWCPVSPTTQAANSDTATTR